MNLTSSFRKFLTRPQMGLGIFLFSILFFSNSSFAQSLIMESPSSGPFSRVIYGHVSLSSVAVFETEYKIEALGEAGKVPMDRAKDSQTSQPDLGLGAQKIDEKTQGESGFKKVEDGLRSDSGEGSEVLTSFSLNESEFSKCTITPRFKGYMALLKAMKPRHVRLVTPPEGKDCAHKILRQIDSGLGTLSVLDEDDTLSGIKVEVLVFSPNKVSLAEKNIQPEVAPPSENDLTFDSLEEVIQNTKITVGESTTTPNSEGFFVIELPEMAEVDVLIEVRGRKPISLKTFPVLLSAVPSQVSKGTSYRARQVLFSKPALSIYITKTPFLTKKTSVDGGLGGGVGYGKEVPGEKKGDRFVSFAAFESRGIWEGLGLRGSLFYTTAKNSVLPRSLTARAFMIYDFPLLDDSLVIRSGVGFELFTAKVQLKRKIVVEGAEDPTALIPQQVSSPFVVLSAFSAPWRGLMVSAHLGLTPLYVPSIGYYPSRSPSLDLGWKFKKERVLMVSMGSETHRFPSVKGETRISLFYSMLSLKLAVF